ncbi:MAG: hypothetical protein IKM21_04885 [Oscillospiraceae bacterium]|nr:hypothetical protein [Oscillospiraceae bacterium]
MSNGKKYVIVGVIIAFVCYCVFALTSFLLFARVDFIFPTTRPKIKYGEFHFRLTYELDGMMKTVEDDIVCKFEGTYLTSTAGVERRWNTYLKSGNERITLLDLSNYNIKNEFDQKILELFFSYGNAQYYMGDEYPSAPQIGKYVECKYRNADGTIGGGAYTAEEAFEKYKIRLINWECDPPVKNKFQ